MTVAQSCLKNDIAVQIKEEESRALYTYCYAHPLNLAVGETVDGFQVLQDTINTTYELTNLVKMSPRSDAKL